MKKAKYLLSHIGTRFFCPNSLGIAAGLIAGKPLMNTKETLRGEKSEVVMSVIEPLTRPSMIILSGYKIAPTD